jgi:hypothetical protein
MLEPYNGRVYDGCCGSGGMFVQSERFVEEHQGNIKDLSIFGQESNPTTLRLAKMNLAIRGIDARIELGDTFLNDKHKDLKADFILANPPFNVSDWSGEHLRADSRWKYGAPPVGNANYAWLQHFAHKLSPSGTAGIVLANGSMNSNSGGEGEIRKNMIEAGLIDCMVAWFFRHTTAGFSNRSVCPAGSDCCAREFVQRCVAQIRVPARIRQIYACISDFALRIRSYPKQTHSLISRYTVGADDVCLAIVGTIGMVFYVDKEWDGANLTENAAKLTDFNQADPKFVYFYLTSSDGQNEIFKNAVGSVQGKLPIYGIQNIELPLPPRPTQTRIAAILSALDDKIELNRQTNATLEAIAQAIFKEWFVDFRFPGATGEMVESEFGMIPRGWRVGKLGDVCSNTAVPSDCRDTIIFVRKVHKLFSAEDMKNVSGIGDKKYEDLKDKITL